VKTELSFAPQNLQQRAGLALYYSSSNFYYLYVSADHGRRFANVLVCDNGRLREDASLAVPLPESCSVELQAHLHDKSVTFSCGPAGQDLVRVGGEFDATILSDDYPLETNAGWAFTGLFAALCGQDATNRSTPADFEWFRYQPSVPS
jgi:xylan 1,4-beta-xylosidase